MANYFRKRLGSDYKKSLSLHHSAREERLIRKDRHWKKKGLIQVKRRNSRKTKKINFHIYFGETKKISTFAVPTETKGNKQDR